MSNPWFGRKSTAQLASQQMAAAKGRSPVTNTMLAAYKQFDDIEFLLTLLSEPMDEGDTQARVDKIRERHEVYRVAHANEDVVK